MPLGTGIAKRPRIAPTAFGTSPAKPLRMFPIVASSACVGNAQALMVMARTYRFPGATRAFPPVSFAPRVQSAASLRAALAASTCPSRPWKYSSYWS